jgi:hypothetical protein
VAVAEPAEDPLSALRDRIRATEQAARRLVEEAAAARTQSASARPAGDATGGPRTPPKGWEAPGGDQRDELAALLALADALRALVPREIAQQFSDLVRQVILLIGAILEWAAGRIGQGGRGREIEVEDIPIS